LILERYIVREITAPFVAICAVLIMIFSGYSAIRFLNDAVNGLLSAKTVTTLVSLKILIAFEVLIPVTLYLSIVLALSRLYSDGEITAMESGGISQSRIIVSVLFLAILLSGGVTLLSLYARPVAYKNLYSLETVGQNEFDISKVEAGRFYDFGDNLVFFAEKLHHAKNQAENVWIWEISPEKREVTTASEAYQINGSGDGEKTILLHNGYHYVLELKNGNDRIVRFQENMFQLDSAKKESGRYRQKAAPTELLALSSVPVDIAEFQWRISTGITTLLMALLAIPLSRAAPRRSRYGKVVVAIILFFLFYNLSLIAKTWVEKSVVGSFPGIWWVNALHLILIAILLPIPSPAHRIWMFLVAKSWKKGIN